MTFPTISKEYPLVLASASPRRKRLLKEIGLPFRSLACDINEQGIEGSPSSIASVLAEMKAKAAYSRAKNSWILGDDTIVVLQETKLGKPLDHDEARNMLRLLSGKEHEVITGFSIINPSGEVANTQHVSSLVNIKDLSEREITAYIETGEPFGKAGSYAIQGIGGFMVRGINGSYSNVVGLPVYSVIEALLALGALDAFPIKSYSL
jgi:septum formation protein